MSTTTTTSIADAASARATRIESARQVFATDVDQANKEFAELVKEQARDRKMTDLAKEAGMTRQTLHDIVKKHAA